MDPRLASRCKTKVTSPSIRSETGELSPRCPVPPSLPSVPSVLLLPNFAPAYFYSVPLSSAQLY